MADETGALKGEAPSDPGDPPEAGEREAPKKERVLHTRVPAVLEQELKRFADSLRIPVSNLVRTILEDAVSVADAATVNFEDRLKNAADKLETERKRFMERVQLDPLKDVYAYQPVTVAQRAICVKCSRDLLPGARAHMGLTDVAPLKGRPRIFVCDGCLPEAGG